MSLRLFKLRVRRFWRRRLAAVRGVVTRSSDGFERFGLARLGRLRASWRFLVVWLGLAGIVGGILIFQIVTLRSYYQTLQPIPGGRYIEGVTGTFTTANPLYAVSDVDTSVARLVFASLLRYDTKGRLAGDLAESWRSNASGNTYTVRLRPHLQWQDGQPLTADDVVYTYQMIQNPDVQSPFYASWHGITVRSTDNQTVVFTLPNPLSSFPSSLTNGIVPKHILRSINPVELRSASFNTANPVGSGPFQWGTIGVSGIGDTAMAQISLNPFAHYWAGKPKLATFSIYAYADAQAMIRAYQNQEITSMVGLQSFPDELPRGQQHVYRLPLLAGVYVFFRTDAPVLHDVRVREALVLAASRNDVLRALDYSTAPVDEPLLKNQAAYNARYSQVTDKLDQARALLLSAGWKLDAAHRWADTHGRVLGFQLVLNDTPEYRQVADVLKREWSSFGVDVQVSAQTSADFQATLSGRSYDAALYGISIGSDPDVFVYWDSSQADARSDTRLNFSDYDSVTADLALESARTRLDPVLRILKYQTFLKAWQQDAPALALYQPHLLYISHDRVYGLTNAPLATDADRFQNVQNWMINTGWETF